MNLQIIDAQKMRSITYKYDRNHKKAHAYTNIWMRRYYKYINSSIKSEAAMGKYKARIIIPKIISKDNESYVKYFLGPNQKDELVKVPAAYVYARNKIIESFQASGYIFNPYIYHSLVSDCDTTVVLNPELDPYYDYNLATRNSKQIYCVMIDILW